MSESNNLHPVSFVLADSRIFCGYTDDSYWNGFINVWVSSGVRDAMVAESDLWEDADEGRAALRALPVDERGLVSLAYGYATEKVPEPTSFSEGARVRLRHALVFQLGRLPMDATGTVISVYQNPEVVQEIAYVRMDQHFPELNPWWNELRISPDGYGEVTWSCFARAD